MKAISPATVTIGVIAIVMGLVGIYVAKQALQPQPEVALRPPPPIPPAPGDAIVVARVNLPAKTRISSRDLTVKRLGRDEEAPADAIGSEAEIVGRISKEPIRAGTIMSDDMLFAIGEGPNPADLIPAGYVAVPINATGARAGEGLVRMGSHVNIAFTVEGEHEEIGQVRTQTLLNNVLVIATGEEDFELPSPTTSSRDRRMMQRQREERELTVAVTQEQANKLITAQNYGTLSVTLCSFDGANQGDTQMVSINDILALSPPPPEPEPAPEPAPEPEPQPYVVEQWSGGSVSLVKLPSRTIGEARDATAADQIRRSEPTVPVGIEEQ